MHHSFVELLAAVPAFATLGGDDRRALLAQAREVEAPAGQQIMRKGEASDGMVVLLAGRLRVGADSAEGRSMSFRLVDPVEIVGEIGMLDGGPRTADVTVASTARLLLLPRAACLRAIDHSPAIAAAMLRLLCARLRQTSGGLEGVATQRLEARLASLLLRLASDRGTPLPGGAVLLPMRLPQEEIGRLVAATREAVNKQLGVWRAEGVIEMQRGRMALLRPGRLAEALG